MRLLVVAAGVGLALAGGGGARAQPGAEPASLQRLLEARREVLRQLVAHYRARYERGRASDEECEGASLDLLQVELELCRGAEERDALHAQLVDHFRRAETRSKARYDAGRITGLDFLDRRIRRREAEINRFRDRPAVEEDARVRKLLREQRDDLLAYGREVSARHGPGVLTASWRRCWSVR
jgi:hypothetical protein